MCGIVGYVGTRNAVPIILDGLRRLEYRGYDSAGLAVLDEDRRLHVRREVGKLDNLFRQVEKSPLSGHVGIGHTRWATHGKPSRRNAHPHTDTHQDVVVVHNGIVENFLSLRHRLMASGVHFTSETDTEVIVHLIDEYLHRGMDFPTAVREAIRHLEGASAIVAMSPHFPDMLVAARLGNAGAVVIGQGEKENFLASDIPAILTYTRNMVFLDDREMAIVQAEQVEYVRIDTFSPFAPRVHTIPWDPLAAAKGEYRHFMQKEIFEQPQSVTDTLRGRVNFTTGEIVLEDLHLSSEAARRLTRIHIVACGTSYYAGLVGKYLIERIARIPVDVDYGSEFRYRDPILASTDVVLAITQSGETVDTLAAMEEARRKNVPLWAIVNVVGSQAARISDGVIYMQAGPEIGVASTKAFTTSVVDLYLLALYLAQQRGILSEEEKLAHVRLLSQLPKWLGETLTLADKRAQSLAHTYYRARHFLYLGRGLQYPIALEGALKLKEISYIHAEGYPAGEMKHGPIALIDEEMPVVVLVPRDPWYEKMISQVEQVKARDGRVIAIASMGDNRVEEKADDVIWIPELPDGGLSYLLLPVLTVIPCQLLAYHIAVRRGNDVDQPRNLAKSVTVE